MERYKIQFLHYPEEDVFADYYDFDDKSEASAWWKSRYEWYKANSKSIKVLKIWPETHSKDKFIKGYEIKVGDKNIWVKISKTTA